MPGHPRAPCRTSQRQQPVARDVKRPAMSGPATSKRPLMVVTEAATWNSASRANRYGRSASRMTARRAATTSSRPASGAGGGVPGSMVGVSAGAGVAAEAAGADGRDDAIAEAPADGAGAPDAAATGAPAGSVLRGMPAGEERPVMTTAPKATVITSTMPIAANMTISGRPRRLTPRQLPRRCASSTRQPATAASGRDHPALRRARADPIAYRDTVRRMSPARTAGAGLTKRVACLSPQGSVS